MAALQTPLSQPARRAVRAVSPRQTKHCTAELCDQQLSAGKWQFKKREAPAVASGRAKITSVALESLHKSGGAQGTQAKRKLVARKPEQQQQGAQAASSPRTPAARLNRPRQADHRHTPRCSSLWRRRLSQCLSAGCGTRCLF